MASLAALSSDLGNAIKEPSKVDWSATNADILYNTDDSLLIELLESTLR